MNKYEKVLCDYEIDNYLGNGCPHTQKEINQRRKELNLEVEE